MYLKKLINWDQILKVIVMLRILNLKLIFHNSGFYELVFLLDVDYCVP